MEKENGPSEMQPGRGGQGTAGRGLGTGSGDGVMGEAWRFVSVLFSLKGSYRLNTCVGVGAGACFHFHCPHSC